MTLENWIMIIAIFIFIVLRQVGEKEYKIQRLLIPVCICIFSIYKYVTIPTTKNGIEWVIGLTILGIIFGLIALATNKFSIKDNVRYVKTGLGYIIVWVVALGARVSIIEYVSKINPKGSYIFMINHGLTISTFETMFTFFTIAMIVVKIIGTYIIFIKKELKV